jgi:hypothetical protein
MAKGWRHAILDFMKPIVEIEYIKTGGLLLENAA